MATSPSLTFEKLDHRKRSFFDWPEEIRQMVYKEYFSDIKDEVALFLVDGLVLPCEPEKNFYRMLKRLEKYQLDVATIGQNYTISLLLVCRTINREAIDRLYAAKHFTCISPLHQMTAMPSIIKHNIRHLELADPFLVKVVTGIEIHSFPRPSQWPQSKLPKVWGQLFSDTEKLQTLILSVDYTFGAMGLYRFWAENAAFASTDTRVFLDITVTHDAIPRRVESFKKNLSAPYLALENAGGQIIPAIDSLTIKCKNRIQEALLRELVFGTCRLVRIGVAGMKNTNDTHCTYELTWLDKNARLHSG